MPATTQSLREQFPMAWAAFEQAFSAIGATPEGAEMISEALAAQRASRPACMEGLPDYTAFLNEAQRR